MPPTVNPNQAPRAGATIGSLLADNDLPRLECTLLLAHALAVRREVVLTHQEMAVPEKIAVRYSNLVLRRQAGEPIAYLVGSREFYGLNLHITPDVLIPRPETELLVEAALRRLNETSPGSVLDLGTGSGAVAIAIGKYRPRMKIQAVDLAGAAVALAMANARTLSVHNVRFHPSDWYSNCEQQTYDVIVSNPPYVSSADPHLGEGDVRFEPFIALTPGEDGLAAIRSIVAGAASRLAPGGWLLFEHGYDQADRCRHLMAEAGFVQIATLRDLAGVERVCEGRMRAGFV